MTQSTTVRLSLGVLLLALVLCPALLWGRVSDGARKIEERQARILNASPAALAAHRLGEAAFERADYEEATRGFATAARLEPHSALACLNLGLAQARAGRNREAVRAMRQAVALEPRWGLAYIHLARLYADAEDLSEAAGAVERATQLAPSTVETWIQRAHVFLLNGDLAEAERSARRAVGLAPRRPDAWLSLGDVLLRVPGDRKASEAAAAFEQALSLAPSGYAYRRLGESRGRARQPAEAVRALREAVRLEPFDASCAYQLSLALRAQGLQAESERWAAKARKLQQERYELAALERKSDQAPGDVSLQLRLAQQLTRLGEPGRAMRAYRRALTLEPENETARIALARLESGGDRPAK